jgi:hypothetical protein
MCASLELINVELITVESKPQCKYCSKLFNDLKKLNNHTPDCYRKNTESPIQRLCPMCCVDYTRKSGSAYRTHIRKCELNLKKDQSDSAVKQSERRRQVLNTAYCKHCNETFENITVGQFGDHRYKCVKSMPNYDKAYQAQYRNDMKAFTLLVEKYYPNITGNSSRIMCQNIRKLRKENKDLDEKSLIDEVYKSHINDLD